MEADHLMGTTRAGYSIFVVQSLSYRIKNIYVFYYIVACNCRVPEGRGVQQIASPPSRNETQSVNTCVWANGLSKIKSGTNAGPILTKAG